MRVVGVLELVRVHALCHIRETSGTELATAGGTDLDLDVIDRLLAIILRIDVTFDFFELVQ
ncbi:MAG TPA: hypothetical protein VF331_11810 [Polyangiales bacterium]